jgi:hypothetical protein
MNQICAKAPVGHNVLRSCRASDATSLSPSGTRSQTWGAIPKPIRPANDWHENDPLLTPERVAKRLNTSLDWVWDQSSRKMPLLPVIRSAMALGERECFGSRIRVSAHRELFLSYSDPVE